MCFWRNNKRKFKVHRRYCLIATIGHHLRAIRGHSLWAIQEHSLRATRLRNLIGQRFEEEKLSTFTNMCLSE